MSLSSSSTEKKVRFIETGYKCSATSFGEKAALVFLEDSMTPTEGKEGDFDVGVLQQLRLVWYRWSETAFFDVYTVCENNMEKL